MQNMILQQMCQLLMRIIKKIDYRVPGSSRPSIIWVLFQEEHIGKDHRKEYSHLYVQPNYR